MNRMITTKGKTDSITKILSQLIDKQLPVKDVEIYSKLPGIYALFFVGENFMLDTFKIPANRIIYIGKTESSQQSRDANTHFKSGRTGSSTVRKSIGALLSQSEEIIPIIRSLKDIEKGRRSHYMFDDTSEEKVTQWMLDNLAVSFYEYPASKEEINSLETELITLLKPVLNIDSKNATNPDLVRIRELRKTLGQIAHSKNTKQNKTHVMKNENTLISTPKVINTTPRLSGKYIEIWTSYLEEIKGAINTTTSRTSINLDKTLFEQAGNRGKYSFRLAYDAGKVSSSIGGSAVARDLDKVLINNNIAVGSHTFRLTNKFELLIEKGL